MKTHCDDRPKKSFTNMMNARAQMSDGEIFEFTFGTLAHYPRVMFVNRIPYSVVNGKPQDRLYVD